MLGPKTLEYHPSSDVFGKTSDALLNKKIVLGVTGSVAIYRAIDLAREFLRRSARVYTVMSPEAAKLVSPEIFRWATGNDVFVEFRGEVGHVTLSQICDAMVIAPASANTVAKISAGISDTSVTLTALNFIGKKKPLVIVPAMHLAMYEAPQIREAISKLKGLGVLFIEPIIEGGTAKFPEIEDIALAAEAAILRGLDLRGINVLVTAGPTREFLDPVRFVTNASSGKMGVAIAKEAFFRGANVTLIHGPINKTLIPRYLRRISVTTTEEMCNTVVNELRKARYDVVILAGAPSDFRFKDVSAIKIDSSIGTLNVTLVSTPKISQEVRKFYNGLLVGFAAETTHGDLSVLKEKALRKLVDRGFDLIVANDVSRSDIGFDSDLNEVLILGVDGYERFVSKKHKELIAREILDAVKEILRRRRFE